MKLLPSELTSQNRTLKCLKRRGRIAIYELYGRGHVLYGYEIIIIKTHPAETLPSGKSYLEREGYPANEDWGDLAWSYGKNFQKEAFERFEGLLSDEQEGRLPSTSRIQQTHLGSNQGRDSRSVKANRPPGTVHRGSERVVIKP
jgi:hypothetical protein